MKKIVITLIIYLITQSDIYAQTNHHTGAVLINSAPLSSSINQWWQAATKIELRPGTTYTPTNGISGVFEISPNVPAYASYESTPYTPTSFETVTSTINTNAPVGTLPGSYAVSPSGAATYSIPIDLPPGTNGMMPQLSINYNSQGGNGILGVGWSMSGIGSSITRTPKTICNEGSFDPIDFDIADRYALDGQQLVLTGGSSYFASDAYYDTENASFSKIVPDQNSVNPGAWGFNVNYKNGNIGIYGYDNDVLAANSARIAWLLKKMQDINGNYITYKYTEGNGIGSKQISEIAYTGNSNISQVPFAKVIFWYQERDDKNLAYSFEKAFESNVVLKKITVELEGNTIREYRFKYTFSEGFTHLQEVTMTDLNGVELNSTKVLWGEVSNPPQNYTPIITNESTTSNPSGWLELTNKMDESPYNAGDFNGDGRTDLIAQNYSTLSPSEFYNKNGVNPKNVSSDPTSSHLILSKINSQNNQIEFETKTMSAGLKFIKMNAAYNCPKLSVNRLNNLNCDFNNDMIEDFLSVQHTRIEQVHHYTLTFFLNSFNNGALSSVQFGNSLTLSFSTDMNDDHMAFYPGDFDGDGNKEVLLLSFGIWKLIKFNNSGVHTIANGGILPFNLMFGNAFFDPSSGTNVSNSISFNSLINCTIPDINVVTENTMRLFNAFNITLGDFNGNSKVDFLSTDIGFEGVYEFNGTKFERVIQVATNNPINVTSNGCFMTLLRSGLEIKPADFNGDGLTDIIVREGSVTKMKLNTGNGFIDVDLQGLNINANLGLGQENKIYIGDFDGDYKSDIVIAKKGLVSYVNSGQYVTNYKVDCEVYYSVGFSLTSPSLAKWKFEQGTTVTINDFTLEDLEDKNWTQWFIGDFNGDGANDILATGKLTQPVSQAAGVSNTLTAEPVFIEFKRNNKHHFVKKVANGFGTKVEFEYQNYSELNPSITNGGSTNISTFKSLKNTKTVVTKILEYNGSNYMPTQYIYGEIVFNTECKRSAGFNTVTSRKFEGPSTNSNYFENQITNYNSTINLGTFKKDYISNSISETNYKNITTNQTIGISRNNSSNISPSINNHGQLKFPTTYQEEWDKLSNAVSVTNSTFDNFGNATNTTIDISDYATSSIISTTTIANTFAVQGTFMTWGIPNMLMSSNTTVSRNETNNNTTYSTLTTYGYDVLGRLERKTSFADKPIHEVSIISYTPAGNIASSSILPGSDPTVTKDYEYDSKYRFVTKEKTQHTDQWISEYTYDNRTGNVLTSKDINGLITQIEYNSMGAKTKTILPNGNISEIILEWALQDGVTDAIFKTTKSSTNSPSNIIYFNKIAQTLQNRTQDFNGAWLYSKPTYNNQGNVIVNETPHLLTETNFNISTNAYDYLNRITATAISSASGGSVLQSSTTTYNSNNSITTVNENGESSTKQFDVTGKLISSSDNGGTITYQYNSRGLTTSTISNGLTTSILYDDYGQKTKLSIPNSGPTFYTYTDAGNLDIQTDANGSTTNFDYYPDGRLQKKVITPGAQASGTSKTYTYTYDPPGNKGLVEKVVGTDETTEYTYSNLGLLLKTRQIFANGIPYEHYYTYNGQGQLIKEKFPIAGQTFVPVEIENTYNSLGFLTNIRNGSTILWQANEVDKWGHISKYKLANGVQSEDTYDPIYGNLIHQKAGSIYEMEYEVNHTNQSFLNGTMTYRRDILNNNQTEYFTYDNVRRLTEAKYSISGTPYFAINYATNGNIDSKSDVGTYEYLGKPNAVNRIKNIATNVAIPTLQQDITYNALQRPETIIENGQKIIFTYGNGGERIRARWLTVDPITSAETNPIKQKVYLGNLEINTDANGTATSQIHYIASPTGLCAIITSTPTSTNGIISTIYTDHLGSICLVQEQGVITRLSYDAWGRRRDPLNWSSYTISNAADLDIIRGYTGHEHLTDFGLINMNARLYDPVLGRMLSVDNVLLDPTNAQDYNKYTYARNNPIMYTDPSGNSVIGDKILNGISTGLDYLFTPFRMIDAPFSWASDKMSGTQGTNYFSWSYLLGQSAPYAASGGETPGSTANSAMANYGGAPNGFTDASGSFHSNESIIFESRVTYYVNKIRKLFDTKTKTNKSEVNEVEYKSLLASVNGVISSSSKPNLTKQFNERLSQMKKLFGGLGKVYDNALGGPILSYPAKLIGFCLIQIDGAGTEFYDPKSQPNSVFTIKGGGYYYKDLFSPDDFGNYAYGAAANAMGITLGDAKWGAGAYSILKNSPSTDYTNIDGLGDERKDTQIIEDGYYGKIHY